MIENIALIYGSDTGMTEEIVGNIIDSWKHCNIDVIEVINANQATFEKYDHFIFGLSTWYDGDLQSDWEDYFDEFKTIDFKEKTIAIFGLGDQYGYAEYFIDGVGMLAEVVLKNGGKIIGKTNASSYDFTESKAFIEEENSFYGLALDEDNEPDKTPKRLENWLSQIHKEFND